MASATATPYFLCTILAVCYGASDFSACVAAGDASFLNDQGDCFWLRLSNVGDFHSMVAAECAPGEGHAAFPQTHDLISRMEALLVAFNVEYAWVGLAQDAGAAEPHDGWQWQLADGTGWPAPSELVHQQRDDATGDQDVGEVSRDWPGSIYDTTSNGHNNPAICQYAPPTRKFERVTDAPGRRIDYPIAETHAIIAIRMHCARLCNQMAICYAFSYSPAAQICHLHEKSSGDPIATRVDDTDFEIWDKLAA